MSQDFNSAIQSILIALGESLKLKTDIIEKLDLRIIRLEQTITNQKIEMEKIISTFQDRVNYWQKCSTEQRDEIGNLYQSLREKDSEIELLKQTIAELEENLAKQ